MWYGRLCAAWSDNVGTAELAAFFTDDAIYHNIPLAPVNGREAIANNISSFIRPDAPGIESIQFRVINIAASGPIVMTERELLHHPSSDPRGRKAHAEWWRLSAISTNS